MYRVIYFILCAQAIILCNDTYFYEKSVEAEYRNAKNEGKYDDKLYRMFLETVIGLAVRKTPANDCTHEKGNEKDG